MDINAYATHMTGVPAAEQFYETPNMDRRARRHRFFASLRVPALFAHALWVAHGTQCREDRRHHRHARLG